MVVILNGAATPRTVKLPEGEWTQVVDGDRVLDPTGDTVRPSTGEVRVAGISANILVKTAS